MLARLGALLPLARYRVEGESMAPALVRDERIVVNKSAYWFAQPRPGDLVVLRDPREGSRLLVKRLAGRAEGDAWLVQGDNAGASTDSRHFGPVERERIVGKVWFRY